MGIRVFRVQAGFIVAASPYRHQRHMHRELQVDMAVALQPRILYSGAPHFFPVGQQFRLRVRNSRKVLYPTPKDVEVSVAPVKSTPRSTPCHGHKSMAPETLELQRKFL